MFVDDDNVISYNENERKRNNEVKSKLIDYNKRGIENIDYINVRVRLCTATPDSVIGNRTPPPASQKHRFTQKHQINFCIDENHRASSQRRSADASAQLNLFSLWHK